MCTAFREMDDDRLPAIVHRVVGSNALVDAVVDERGPYIAAGSDENIDEIGNGMASDRTTRSPYEWIR